MYMAAAHKWRAYKPGRESISDSGGIMIDQGRKRGDFGALRHCFKVCESAKTHLQAQCRCKKKGE